MKGIKLNLALKSLTSQSHVFLSSYDLVLGQSSACPRQFDRTNLSNVKGLSTQKLVSMDIQVTIELKNKSIYNYMILKDQEKVCVPGGIKITRTRGPGSNYKDLRNILSKRVHESSVSIENYKACSVDKAWTNFKTNMGEAV